MPVMFLVDKPSDERTFTPSCRCKPCTASVNPRTVNFPSTEASAVNIFNALFADASTLRNLSAVQKKKKYRHEKMEHRQLQRGNLNARKCTFVKLIKIDEACLLVKASKQFWQICQSIGRDADGVGSSFDAIADSFTDISDSGRKQGHG